MLEFILDKFITSSEWCDTCYRPASNTLFFINRRLCLGDFEQRVCRHDSGHGPSEQQVTEAQRDTHGVRWALLHFHVMYYVLLNAQCMLTYGSPSWRGIGIEPESDPRQHDYHDTGHVVVHDVVAKPSAETKMYGQSTEVSRWKPNHACLQSCITGKTDQYFQ